MPIDDKKISNTSTASPFMGWPIIDPSDGIIARILRYFFSFWEKQPTSPPAKIEAINLTNEATFETFQKYVNDSFIPTLTLAEKKFEKLETASELGTYYEDLFKLRAMQAKIDGYKNKNASNNYTYTIIVDPYQKVNALAKRLKEHSLNAQRILLKIQVNESSPRSTPGINNGGNGCFANSLFQVLFNVPILQKWLFNAPLENMDQWLEKTVQDYTKSIIEQYQQASKKVEEKGSVTSEREVSGKEKEIINALAQKGSETTTLVQVTEELTQKAIQKKTEELNQEAAKRKNELATYRERLNSCLWTYKDAQRTGKSSVNLATAFRKAVDTLGTNFSNFGQHDTTELFGTITGALDHKDHPLFHQMEERVVIQDFSSKKSSFDQDLLQVYPDGFSSKEDVNPGYWALDIDKKNVESLSTLLDRYMNEPEVVDDYNLVGKSGKSYGQYPIKRQRRIKGDPPEILPISFKRYTDPKTKNETKVYIEPEFYLEGRHFSDNRENGAKYKIHGFVTQSGGTGGGHYVSCYRIDEKTWMYCNDSSTRTIDETSAEFKRLLQTSYILFSECVDKNVSKEKERAEALSFTERVNRAALKKGEEREVALLGLFNEKLMLETAQGKDLEYLLDCFNKFDKKTQDFLQIVLKQAKLWEERNLKEQLLNLKEIELKLNSEVTGNIVAQYVYILEQRNRLAALDKKATAYEKDELTQTLNSIEKTEGHLNYLIDCLTALAKVEDDNQFSELLGVYGINEEFVTFRQKWDEALKKTIQEARQAMLEKVQDKLNKLIPVKETDSKFSKQEEQLRKEYEEKLQKLKEERLKEVLNTLSEVPQGLWEKDPSTL